MGRFDNVFNITLETSAPGGGNQTVIGVSDSYTSRGAMGFVYASRTMSNTLYGPAIIGMMSLMSVVSLLIVMSIRAYRNKGKDGGSIFFFKTPIGLVLLAMLVCDMLQSAGWIVNFVWATQGYQTIGKSCQFQAAVEVASTLGGAIWSTVLSLLSFSVLFLGVSVHMQALYWIISVCLVFIFAITLASPYSYLAIDLDPQYFYGPENQWCFISGGDSLSHGWVILIESIAAASAAISLVLYIAIVAKLNGYLSVHNRRIAFHWSSRSISRNADDKHNLSSGERSGDRRAGRGGGGKKIRGGQTSSKAESVDTQVRAICKKLILYPIVYITLNVPIMAVRLFVFTHPYEEYLPWTAFISVASIEAASGMADVALLLYTRHSLVMKSRNPTSFAVSGGLSGVHVHTLHETHLDGDEEIADSLAMSRGPFTSSRNGKPLKSEMLDDDLDLDVEAGELGVAYLSHESSGAASVDMTLSELELGGKAESFRTGKSVDHEPGI